MNKDLLFQLLLDDLKQHADKHYNRKSIRARKLEEALHELNNWRDITLPLNLPSTPDRMLLVLRKHFKDDVNFISLILNHYFPDKYFFYRVAKIEQEIFQGLDFFSEIIPQFAFQFSSVGTKGFDRYLELNTVLMQFAHGVWPKVAEPQIELSYFLYQGLGHLFLERDQYHRYWVMATKEEYFRHLDSGETLDWSGRKEMKAGDLVFMYRTAPRSAITDICRVSDATAFSPWREWGGFSVDMEKVCAIDDISLVEMLRDSILGQWGTARKHFQGTVTEPVPHSIYNRLLDKMPKEIRLRYDLKPEPVAPTGDSGKFTSEAEFETEVIEPLLKRWSLKYRYQHPCRFCIGSQYHPGRVDFLVSDERGPVTLFEDKLRIINDKDLQPAVDQAKSYALQLGLPSFVVAAPEGLWLYSLDRHLEKLVRKVTLEELKDSRQEEGFRDSLRRLRL